MMHTRFSVIVFRAAPVAFLVAACIGERGPFTNRMAHTGTTYLSRAARQPVRWQPWGREAFALAAKLDRPVLLYIGSDACRWCARSDREIYTDPEIGSLINSLFVPVRVDRDERPDVAQRYQAAVEHLAGLHGWPLTVFLTSDGSAFFGGTYFPADDPITGRGLKQVLPEVAKSYREQRASIVRQAALVRQLVLRGNDSSRGVLQPSLIQDGIVAVTHELDDALRGRGAAGSVMHAEAAGLLSRTADTTAQAVARRALDLMLDDTAIAAGEDPPRLVRAALAGSVAQAWAATGETRYREAGRVLVRELAAELPHLSALGANRTGAVFVDQEAYVIEQLLIAATTFGDSAAQHRAATELDALLQRTYARGWGVRHAITGAAPAGTTTPLGLLQDQVQVAAACLAAHQVTNGERYLDVAVDLAGVVERAFADPLGGYFDAADALPSQYAMPALADRTKNVFDDVLPGPNARAALLFAHLARVTGDPVYRRRAQATLEAFAAAVNGVGLRASTYLAAAQEILGKP
ncbi:MAG TPA: DUF255 domain-containing protein [Gemmatimonadales bacterium]|jgi:uncharacterized protein YyaL (SSP411 family)|nr:DUF255 domain-containing protein [Gemmatimonadales bacterium]